MTQIFKNKSKNPSFIVFVFFALFGALTLAGGSVQASDGTKHSKATKQSKADKECDSKSSKGSDTWIEGKLEGAYLLNKHLNSMEIDTVVKNQTVFLSGNVDTEVEKDLAGEIAKSIEGVEEVENKLTVRPEKFRKKQEKSAKKDETDDDGERDFVQKVKDASITAAVKVKLLANSNTDGSDINVDTQRQTVTLRGKVHSPEEKDLAEKIAMNTEDVLKVANELKVDASKE